METSGSTFLKGVDMPRSSGRIYTDKYGRAKVSLNREAYFDSKRTGASVAAKRLKNYKKK